MKRNSLEIPSSLKAKVPLSPLFHFCFSFLKSSWQPTQPGSNLLSLSLLLLSTIIAHSLLSSGCECNQCRPVTAKHRPSMFMWSYSMSIPCPWNPSTTGLMGTSCSHLAAGPPWDYSAGRGCQLSPRDAEVFQACARPNTEERTLES